MKSIVMKNLRFLLFSFLAISVNAQEWVNYTNGLHVNDMVQDGDVLWIATNGGLVQRDINTGENTYFTRGDSPIPSNLVRSLAIDSEHNLWLSTDRGSAIFDGTDWTLFYDKSGILALDNDGRMILAESGGIHWWDGQDFETVETSLTSDYQVKDIIVDAASNDIWLTYNTFGIFYLFRHNDQGLTRFNHENTPLPFESSTNNPLLLDAENRLWLGTYSGLFRLDDEVWLDFSTSTSGFPQGVIDAIGRSADGNIWVIVTEWANGSLNGSLVEIKNDDSFIIHNFPESIDKKTDFSFIKFLPSFTPTIHIGTDEMGLWEYDFSSWERIPTNQSKLSRNSIRQIFIDCATSYISTGLNYGITENNTQFAIKEGEWVFTKTGDLPAALNNAWRVKIVDKTGDGTFWVHVEDTLYSVKNGNWSVPVLPDIMEGVAEINSLIHHEPDGKRWLLETYHAFIFHETSDGWQIFDRMEHGALGGNYEAYFTHPRTGDFWLASANGISRYDGQEWSVIKPSNLEGIYTDWVDDMEVDSDGTVWAVTRNGVLKIEDNIPEVFVSDIPGFENYRFNSITFDQQNRMWLGLYNAIALLDDGEWILFDNKNSGVPNGFINELEIDIAGNLWIGSGSGGLAIYNEKGLPEYFLSDSTLIPDSLHTIDDIAFTVSPNPVLRSATLDVEITDSNELDKTSQLIFYNNLGQWIHTIPICSKDVRLALESFALPAGVYFLQLQHDSKSSTRKVILH